MSDMHPLSGAYAVDALDDLERVRFERHLGECSECAAEVRSLQEAAGVLSHVVATGPSPMVRQQVLAEIHTVRPLAPVPAPVRAVRHRARRFPQLVAAAVAAVLLVIGGGVAALKPWQSQSSAPIATPQRVMDASDARAQAVSFANGSRATLYHSKSVNRSVIVTRGMKDAPLGKVYELWYLNAKGAFVPAGLMGSGSSQTVVLHGALGDAKGVGITVEPSAGSDHPSSAPIALFKLNKSV